MFAGGIMRGDAALAHPRGETCLAGLSSGLSFPNGDEKTRQWCAHRLRSCAISGQKLFRLCPWRGIELGGRESPFLLPSHTPPPFGFEDHHGRVASGCPSPAVASEGVLKSSRKLTLATLRPLLDLKHFFSFPYLTHSSALQSGQCWRGNAAGKQGPPTTLR